jgi:endonuclease/exonuclease/phosphatase family metal-dependent hydrolase
MPKRNGKNARTGLGICSLFFVILVIFTLAVPQVFAHPGGLDEYGGHAQGQGGHYHFHRGPLADQTFETRNAALEALRKAGGQGSDLQEIHLASFNIRVFSDKSRNDEELDRIVALLKDFDIVAIQELRDTRVLARTRDKLREATGAEWRFEASEPVGRGVKELYAFLYRTDRVLVKNPGKTVDDPKDLFIREPYYATFRAGNFDFTLLTIHALYKSKDAPERKVEFDALADVFRSIEDADPTEKDLILLGDFNDDPTQERFQAVMRIPGMRCLFLPPVKTTISDESLYDNICFRKEPLTEFRERQGVVKFDETMFGGDDEAARLAVSDHRPVWAVFATDRDDD